VTDLHRLAEALRDIHQGAVPDVSQIRQILALDRITSGQVLESVCRELSLQPHRVRDLAAQVSKQGLSALVNAAAIPAEAIAIARNGIAQMLLSLLAERRFIQLSNQITGAGVLKIEDHRPSRSDTVSAS